MVLKYTKKQNKILFVVGNSRSGTTMMGRILGKHPEIYTFGELHFFGQLCSATTASNLLSHKTAEELASQLFCIQREGYRTHAHPRGYRQNARTFLDALCEFPETPAALFFAFLSYEASEHQKTIPCDQTPRNVFYIDEILRLYPEAHIINMIRDPRDVLLSQKRKWKRRFLGGTDMPMKETLRDWINYHPITISRIWRTAVTTADRFVDSKRVLSIYFEKLLAHPETTVRQVCDFVGIIYTDTLLQVPQVGSSVNADNVQQLGINPDRANSWQSTASKDGLSSAEIYLCQVLNATVMRKHNYSSVSIRPNRIKLALDLFSFPIKLGLAFLFNLDRMKNIRETLKRRFGRGRCAASTSTPRF